MLTHTCAMQNVAGNKLKVIKNKYSVKCGPWIQFMPLHAKVLDICFRTEKSIPAIYRRLPVPMYRTALEENSLYAERKGKILY